MEIPEIKVFNNEPKIYAYPWTRLTNITDNYVELHCAVDYEPTAIIKINVHDDNINIENFDGNKEQWENDMNEKLERLNTPHCVCCQHHNQDRSVILPCRVEKLQANTPFSQYYLNWDDPKFSDLLSDQSYNQHYRHYNCLYSYSADGINIDVWFDRIYIISDNEANILNILHAPKYHLQMGDDFTKVRMINNELIVVENVGDVESCVIFKI